MAKQYNSVSELVEHLTDDKAFRADLQKEIAAKSLAKTLFVMRCSKGITQAQMAERLGCGQARISKLENSTLDSIKVADLVSYAKALDLQLSIGFHKNFTAAEWVKFYAFQIKRHLDYLAELAHKDDQINKGVTAFFREAIVNILNLIQSSAQLLPARKPGKPPVLEISPPTDEVEHEEVLVAG